MWLSLLLLHMYLLRLASHDKPLHCYKTQATAQARHCDVNRPGSLSLPRKAHFVHLHRFVLQSANVTVSAMASAEGNVIEILYGVFHNQGKQFVSGGSKLSLLKKTSLFVIFFYFNIHLLKDKELGSWQVVMETKKHATNVDTGGNEWKQMGL